MLLIRSARPSRVEGCMSNTWDFTTPHHRRRSGGSNFRAPRQDGEPFARAPADGFVQARGRGSFEGLGELVDGGESVGAVLRERKGEHEIDVLRYVGQQARR